MKIALFFSAAVISVALLFSGCGNNTGKSDVDQKNDSIKDKAPTSKTIENLKAGIKGETTASAKYEAFAKKAGEDGYPQIQKLFEAASKSESIHAGNHTKALEKMGVKMEAFTPEFTVKTTAENLQEAINGEGSEITSMYPGFITDAQNDNADEAVRSFQWAMETEKKHKEFYSAALDALNKKAVKKLSLVYYVCPKCGNTYSKETTKGVESCDFCGVGSKNFLEIK
jgi:rubrerythrin